MPKIKYIQPVSAVATSQYNVASSPEATFDPSTDLVGDTGGEQWGSAQYSITNQKLNAAFVQAQILKRLVINNGHYQEIYSDSGAKDIILYGTNVEAAYLNTTYANLDDLTELHSFQLRRRIDGPLPDPQEIALPVITQEYKYYVFRIANCWGSDQYIAVRQIDMYFQDPEGLLYTKQGGHWEESLDSYVKTPGGARYEFPSRVVGTGQFSSYAPAHAFEPQGPGNEVAIAYVWLNGSTPAINSNQKLNADYTTSKLLSKLIIRQYGAVGNEVVNVRGSKDCIVYGTNSEAAYLNVTYANTVDLTEIASFQIAKFTDGTPQEIALPVLTTEYRYYVFRIANNWGDAGHIALCQIDMYFEKEPWQPSQQNYIKLAGKWIPRSAKYVQPTSAKATTTHGIEAGDHFYPRYSFDPATSLVGSYRNNAWLAAHPVKSNQKLNAAFEVSRILKRLVINNDTDPTHGIKDVILYGSNVVAAYNNITYSNLTDLTQLHTFQVRKRVILDAPDPQEIALPDTTQPFKYYIFRIANNWGGDYFSVRQIDMYFEQ